VAVSRKLPLDQLARVTGWGRERTGGFWLLPYAMRPFLLQLSADDYCIRYSQIRKSGTDWRRRTAARAAWTVRCGCDHLLGLGDHNRCCRRENSRRTGSPVVDSQLNEN